MQSENSSPSRIAVIVGGLLATAIVGCLDWLTGPELAVSILYLFPVGICAWLAGRGAGIFMSILSAAIWTLFDIADGRPYSNSFVPYWNGLVRLGIFITIALLLDIIRNLAQNLQDLVRERTAALEAEIRNRKELERVVTEISAREQQRLGAELHDQLAGHLAGVAFLAKVIAESLARRGLPEAPDADKLVGFLNQSLKQLRLFCRLLAPVDSGNLEPGLSRLGAEVETAFGITCIVQSPKDPPQLGLNRARLLYSIAQEAVRRAVEKRMAKHVEISLTEGPNELTLVISDDGVPREESATPDEQELGVRVMHYRADTLGGAVTIARGPLGGSCVTCVIPLDSQDAIQPFPAMS